MMIAQLSLSEFLLSQNTPRNNEHYFWHMKNVVTSIRMPWV